MASRRVIRADFIPSGAAAHLKRTKELGKPRSDKNNYKNKTRTRMRAATRTSRSDKDMMRKQNEREKKGRRNKLTNK